MLSLGGGVRGVSLCGKPNMISPSRCPPLGSTARDNRLQKKLPFLRCVYKCLYSYTTSIAFSFFFFFPRSVLPERCCSERWRGEKTVCWALAHAPWVSRHLPHHSGMSLCYALLQGFSVLPTAVRLCLFVSVQVFPCSDQRSSQHNLLSCSNTRLSQNITYTGMKIYDLLKLESACWC